MWYGLLLELIYGFSNGLHKYWFGTELSKMHTYFKVRTAAYNIPCECYDYENIYNVILILTFNTKHLNFNTYERGHAS
jgi:hypothetical protein